MNRSTAPLRRMFQRFSAARSPGPAKTPRNGNIKGSAGIIPSRGQQVRHAWFSRRPKPKPKGWASTGSTVIILGAIAIYSLYPAKELRDLEAAPKKEKKEAKRRRWAKPASDTDEPAQDCEKGAWANFANSFEKLSFTTDLEWGKYSDKLVDFILPEWYKLIPGYVRKLQREMSMAPDSLAGEIWNEAHDPFVNPEIRYAAKVRVSSDLCDEEKEFLARRKRIASVAMAKYLGLEEKDVHPDDVPIIAMCGSGGGLRALVAGSGSLLATSEEGLFDCVTYLSGVSGSCWLQALYFSSITERNFHRAIDHLKSRLGVHIAYPPVAFSSVISAPTNKYLLSGMVEKLKGDPKAVFGLVDVYGLLLAARLLVPKGELGVNEKDFKLSSQREYVRYGQNPLPIYTAVRHEIPEEEVPGGDKASSVAAPRKEKQSPWFQWFEVTPYEFFCEEFTAGIPTWAMGRKFKGGADVPAEDGLHLPEIRMPFLFGTFGSAFCATLSHYYREIRPLVLSLSGFGAVDEMIYGREEDLSKVHPINPATLPNFAYGMKDALPKIAPKSIYENEYLELMDAGMSNNLPIYPLLRPGRGVEVLIAFDASADIKTDNWLSVADGYAKQRGITGWPVGIGWPKVTESAKKAAKELDQAQASSTSEADSKLEEAKVDQAVRRTEAHWDGNDTGAKGEHKAGDEAAGELGYCTVWVGTTQERSTSELPPPSKAIDDTTSWRLMEPDAGLTVVYCPFLPNDKVPGVDPATSDYMSTWNFVYNPDQVDKVVSLARANFDESKEQIRATVRAVYERKKRIRLQEEARVRMEQRRRLVRLGLVGKLGEGDHFS